MDGLRLPSPPALGFQARAMLICNDTGSYCDLRNCQDLNLALRDALDQGEALTSLSQTIADCSERLREDGRDLVAEGECRADIDIGQSCLDAADKLDALNVDVAAALADVRGPYLQAAE